jgi:hypothetical protein
VSIFLCTPDGDFAIVNNQLWLTDNSVSAVPEVAAMAPSAGQETLQLIRNNLRMGLAEEPLDLSLGVPYMQQILQKGTPLETVQTLLYEAIQDTPGVLAVLNFATSLDKATRHLTVTFTVQTDSGPVTSTETFP